MNTVPVVLFAYRRPDILTKALAGLHANCIPLLYVFSDAAARKEYEGDVANVRALLKQIDWCDAIVTIRSHNMGLGRSILDGVTQVLHDHESAIVLEDDLVVVPGFYKYMVSAIAHYQSNTRVMSVTGWTHPIITPHNVGNLPYFDGKAECWTWGTWRSRWGGMTNSAVTLMQQCMLAGIDHERYGKDLPKMAIEEEAKNLWAIRWWYLHLLNRALCLRPPYSMVEHLGFDERATTCVGATRWANPPLRECVPIPSQWPEPVEHPDTARLWRLTIGEV